MSIGESKVNLANAGRLAQDGGALDTRAAAELEAGAEMIRTAKENVGDALAHLFTIIGDTNTAVTGIHASYKGVHGEVGSVVSRVEGSVLDPLKDASRTLVTENTATKKELGQAQTALDAVRALVRALTTAQGSLDKSAKSATDTADKAKQGAAKQTDAGQKVVAIASKF